MFRTKRDCGKAVSTLNQLLDAGAADEKSPLADLVNTLGTLIADYDDAHHPAKEVSSVAMIRFLMEQHDLTQSDPPEIGTQGVVSEILRGKRELNIRQIKALSERFHVPSSVFI
jgi:HTH-type transcriptional regulator/antitoxin HigA